MNKRPRLSGSDDVLSASMKLADDVPEARDIILQMLRGSSQIDCVYRLLDMDDMEMYGLKIVQAYHDWANHDYKKLLVAITNRDPSLIKCIGKVPTKPTIPLGKTDPLALIGGKWNGMTTAQIIEAEGDISRGEFQKRKLAGKYKE